MHKKITQWHRLVAQISGAIVLVLSVKKWYKGVPVLIAGKSYLSGLKDQNEAIQNGFINCEPSQTWLGLDKGFKNTGYGFDKTDIMGHTLRVITQLLILFQIQISNLNENLLY